ncbi:MAG: SUMF1/EgtB/PvdO family nonheme iron enzyme, partial [Bacteroidales bacterium]|nr:SUMF1/EgtB/PvdO family nonheme iron enzyme [Bacteroidales bacterium]
MIGVNLKYSIIKEFITSFFCMLSLLSLSAQDSYSSLSREYAPGALESLSPSGGNYVETAMGLNLRMVFVDGGTFEMGATAEQAKDAANTERPVRKITMSPYYIGMFEITQEQWKKVMGTIVQDLGHDMRGVGEDFPMYYVSWDDA